MWSSIKDVRTLGGGGEDQAKVDKCGRGGAWLAKCGCPLGKKIVATIFVKYLVNHACVSHFLVNSIFWNAIIEIV